jgi:AMIN domain
MRYLISYIIFLYAIIFTASLFAQQNLHAQQKLISYSEPALTVELTETNQSNVTLNLVAKNYTSTAVFSLADPSRVVLDIVGPSIKKNKTFNLENDALIKSVRLGSYTDKIRIVLDIKATLSPPYQWTEGKEKLSLTFNRDLSAANKEDTPKEKSPQEIVSPTATSTNTIVQSNISPTPTIQTPEIATPAVIIPLQNTPATFFSATPVAINTYTPTQASSPSPAFTVTATHTIQLTPTVFLPTILVPTIEPTPLAPTEQALNLISFTSNSESSPVIQLSLNLRPEFEVQKKDDKTYQILIKNCKVTDPKMTLIQFPPSDFVGFTFVLAKDEKSGTIIDIGVERGTKITAAPKDQSIEIKTINQSTLLSKSPPKPKKK